jgi:hypothetical protein
MKRKNDDKSKASEKDVKNDDEAFAKKFTQSLGPENYNDEDEPIVSPPDDVKKSPSTRPQGEADKSK